MKILRLLTSMFVLFLSLSCDSREPTERNTDGAENEVEFIHGDNFVVTTLLPPDWDSPVMSRMRVKPNESLLVAGSASLDVPVNYSSRYEIATDEGDGRVSVKYQIKKVITEIDGDKIELVERPIGIGLVSLSVEEPSKELVLLEDVRVRFQLRSANSG